MGLIQKRTDITSIHLTFEDGSEMLVTEFPKGVFISELNDYGRDKDEPKKIWEIRWVEQHENTD